MTNDNEKIDEYTLAPLYLVIHNRIDGYGCRVYNRLANNYK